MKRIAMIVGGVVVVLIVGLFVVLATIDVNQYKGVVQEQVATATGRTLTIEGDMDLAISLSPAIVLNGVRFQNAEWGSRPDMAVIERIEASVPLIPLISGNIEVTRLALINPDILLERNAQGRANWEFQTDESTDDVESDATAMAISSIEIDDAKLVFKDAQAGSDVSAALGSLRTSIAGTLTNPTIRRLNLDDLAATIESNDGTPATELAITTFTLTPDSSGTEVDLEAIVSGQTVSAKGSVGPLERLVAMDGDFPAKLKVRLDDFEFDADLKATLSGVRPKIVGTLKADEVDLSALTAEEEAPLGAKIFPSDPIPMDILKVMDADINIEINRIVLIGDLAFTDAKTNLVLDDGRLRQTQTASIAGGAMSSETTFAAPDGSVTIQAKGQGISAEGLAKDLGASDLITKGDIDFDVDLRGRGNTVANIMSSLDGSMVAGMGEARIRNDAINLAGADFLAQLISKINPFIAQEEFTVAQCAVVNLQVQDGVARTDKGIAFVSDRMEITSSGNINLGEEKLDLNIRPKAKEGLGVGMGKLTQMIKVTGPLSSPGIGLDAGGTVKALGSIAGAFATGGASLLAEGALERGQSGGDTCQTARTWHLAGQ